MPSAVVLIVAGLIIVVLIGLFFWLRPQRVIGVSPASMTINKDSTVTYTAQLLYKSWFKRTFNPIRGTITSSGANSLVFIVPLSIATQRPTRLATINVTGLAVGVGKIVVNGTSRKGSHNTAKIAFTVV